MKSNTEHFHLTMSTGHSVNFRLGDSRIERSDCEKMSAVKFDYKLTDEVFFQRTV